MAKREDTSVLEARIEQAITVALTERVAGVQRSVRRTVVEAARSIGRWKPYRRLSQWALAMFAAVVLLSGGVSVAAASAQPGSPAYVLKRAAERIALEVVPGGAIEDALRASFAERRAVEIRELLRSGADEEALRRALESMGIALPASSSTGDGGAADVLRRELRRIESGSASDPAVREPAAGEGSGQRRPSGEGGPGASGIDEGTRDGHRDEDTRSAPDSQPTRPGAGSDSHGSSGGANAGGSSSHEADSTLHEPDRQESAPGAGGQRQNR